MSKFIKPNVVVSQCLEFDRCRYDGQMVSEVMVRRLNEHVHFIPVCPEVAIGMGTPRDPIKIVEQNGQRILYQPDTGKEFSDKMVSFSLNYLKKLKNIDGFILKSQSPSCGIKDVKVYGQIEKSASIKRDSGFFATEVIKRFSDIAVESEMRLTNYNIREHFMTRVFALARLRKLCESPKMKDLVRFHAEYKFILMAHNQVKMRDLGKIVANAKIRDVKDVFDLYSQGFKHALLHPAKYKSHMNVLEHAFGYFKEELVPKEKQFFLKSIRQYESGKLGLTAILTMLRGWMIRYHKTYLLEQVYFEPFPEELIDLMDSGK